MRTVVIGDIHLDSKSRRHLLSQLSTLEAIIADENPDEIIFLGDIFMHRNPSPRVLVGFKELLDIWTDANITVHLLRGNHDSADKSDNGLTALEVYRSQYVYVWNHFGAYNDKYFIPHYENEDTIRDFLSRCPKDAQAFGHFGYLGSLNSVGDADSTLSISDFKCKTYLGHIHNFKQNGLVTILGTPYSTNYGEAGTQGYYLVLHEQAVGPVREEFKEIRFGPRHVVTSLDEANDKAKELSDASWYTMLRVALRSDQSASELSEDLRVDELDIKVAPAFGDDDEISMYKPNRDLFTINEQIITDYVESCDVSPTLTKENLMEGYSLLKNGEPLPDED